MVETRGVAEVGPVDGELVKCVELGFEGVVGGPGVCAGRFEHVHPVVDGGTRVVAVHIDFRWWLIVVWICGEDDVPAVVELMEFRCPSGRSVSKRGISNCGTIGMKHYIFVL